jgi:hypothetical protein
MEKYYISNYLKNCLDKGDHHKYSAKILELFQLRSSVKHMRNVDMNFCNQRENQL